MSASRDSASVAKKSAKRVVYVIFNSEFISDALLRVHLF